MSSKTRAVKKIIAKEEENIQLLPAREKRSYTANMDNVLIEGIFRPGSNKDKDGKFVPAKYRTEADYTIISVGPVVNNPSMKKGAKVIPANSGRITVIDIDEEGIIGSIKHFDILAVVK